MDLNSLRGYINGEVTCEDRRFLDSFEGTRDAAYEIAMEYGRILRKNMKCPNLVVSVVTKNSRLHYLYLEADAA